MGVDSIEQALAFIECAARLFEARPEFGRASGHTALGRRRVGVRLAGVDAHGHASFVSDRDAGDTAWLTDDDGLRTVPVYDVVGPPGAGGLFLDRPDGHEADAFEVGDP